MDPNHTILADVRDARLARWIDVLIDDDGGIRTKNQILYKTPVSHEPEHVRLSDGTNAPKLCSVWLIARPTPRIYMVTRQRIFRIRPDVVLYVLDTVQGPKPTDDSPRAIILTAIRTTPEGDSIRSALVFWYSPLDELVDTSRDTF